jgi:hypothetical protein
MKRQPPCNMLRLELEREVTELRDGTCRFNCRTGKSQFARGAEWAIGFLPDGWEAAYTELKGREQWKTTNDS